MLYVLVKTFISAAILVAASEVSKRSTAAGAFLIALPLNSMLAFSWLYIDTKDAARVQALSQSVMLLIVPSLAFFVILPFALKGGLGFAPAMILATLSALGAFWIWDLILRCFNVTL